MKRKIVFAAMVAAVFSACEKKEIENTVPEAEPVTLEVKVPVVPTKVTDVGNEDAVSSYQIFVYSNDDGMLEAYMAVSGGTSAARVQCTTGSKEIVVLANAPDLKTMTSLSQLKETRSRLEHNGVGNLVMEGSKTVVLTASSTVEIPLKRLVAKVRLKNVTLDFDSESYAAMDFEITSVYLINVPADRKYLTLASDSPAPAEWYNKLKYESDSRYDALLKDVVNSGPIDSYDREHVFYTYPNPCVNDDYSDVWSERPTRLVVEARLGGMPYYYPISLPVLKQNTVYDVSLTVTRPGKTEVNDEMQKYEETFNIKVLDWENGYVLEEIL